MLIQMDVISAPLLRALTLPPSMRGTSRLGGGPMNGGKVTTISISLRYVRACREICQVSDVDGCTWDSFV